MEINKIYKLSVYSSDNTALVYEDGHFPCDKRTIGYFDSLHEAVSQITLTKKCDYLLFFKPILFTIEVMNINCNRFITPENDIEEISSYDSDGKYITTVMRNFNGRLEGEITHKQGEIVICVSEKYAFYGIVGYPPLSAKEATERNINCLDMSDDGYLVYEIGYGDTHMHIPSTHILPVSEDKVHSMIVEKLKEKYQEMSSRKEIN